MSIPVHVWQTASDWKAFAPGLGIVSQPTAGPRHFASYDTLFTPSWTNGTGN